MAAIIVADSLYSKQPCVERLRAARFSFLLVAKPGDHTSLYQDVDGLRRGNLLNRHATDHRGERREYEWVTDMPLNGQPDSPLINFIQFRIVKDGKINYRNAWVTDLVPTTDNIAQLDRLRLLRQFIEIVLILDRPAPPRLLGDGDPFLAPLQHDVGHPHVGGRLAA